MRSVRARSSLSLLQVGRRHDDWLVTCHYYNEHTGATTWDFNQVAAQSDALLFGGSGLMASTSGFPDRQQHRCTMAKSSCGRRQWQTPNPYISRAQCLLRVADDMPSFCSATITLAFGKPPTALRAPDGGWYEVRKVRRTPRQACEPARTSGIRRVHPSRFICNGRLLLSRAIISSTSSANIRWATSQSGYYLAAARCPLNDTVWPIHPAALWRAADVRAASAAVKVSGHGQHDSY